MTDDQINALTDPQINVMMTFAVNELTDPWQQTMSGKFVVYRSSDGEEKPAFVVKDYCNDPAAMMPIAFENGIGYVSGDGMVLAMKIHSAMENADGRIEINPDVKFIEYSDKVCRALAIVYLKSKGVL